MPASTIKTGDLAPDFELKNQHREVVKLQDYLGKKNIILFFYPKDDTPGCTVEVCSFRDHFQNFEDLDAVLLGISSDSVASHERFSKKHNLQYSILSDKGGIVRKMYEVPDFFWFLAGRVTFVIDKSGRIVRIFNSLLQPAKHVREALLILADQNI